MERDLTYDELRRLATLEDGFDPRDHPPQIQRGGYGLSACSYCGALFKGKHVCDKWIENVHRVLGR